MPSTKPLPNCPEQKLTARTKSQALARLLEGAFRRCPPQPKLTVSQWADAYRVLSSEDSAEPGRWRTSRGEYLRAIMDAVSLRFGQRPALTTIKRLAESKENINDLV